MNGVKAPFLYHGASWMEGQMCFYYNLFFAQFNHTGIHEALAKKIVHLFGVFPDFDVVKDEKVQFDTA